MAKNKKPLSIFITDNGIAFFGGSIEKNKEKIIYGQQSLPVGVIENGYIKEPEILLENLKNMWKEHKIKPKFVRFVIQDQNVLVREFKVEKKALERKSIKEYFHNQIGNNFHVPFEKPILSYQVKKETETDFTILLYISDDNLLQDYQDVMEQLGIKDIIFDLAVTALLEIADEDYDLNQQNAMIITLYDKQVSIQIFEDNQLIFGIIEECDDNESNYIDKIEIYSERVANYYKYNMRKGDKEITKTIIFNLNDYIETKEIEKELIPRLKNINAKLFKLDILNDISKDLPKGSIVAYASNQILQSREKDEKIIDFKLNRINKLKQYGYYIAVIALAIFSAISIIYVPYNQNRDAIYEQQFLNDALTSGLNMLETEENQTDLNQNYIDSYNLIEEYQNDFPLSQFTDIQTIKPNNIDILDINFEIQEKQITLVINGDSTIDCLDFVLLLYETYGISDANLNDNQWILNQPTHTIISDSIVEVTINYA
ncbi:MAG: type IV pilus biogenesis protein PilM [Bacillota bacterium]